VGSRLVKAPPGIGATAPPSSLLGALREEVARRRKGFETLGKFLLVGAGGYVAYQLTLFVAYDSSLLRFLPAKDTAMRMVFFTHGDVRFLFSTLLAAQLSIMLSFTVHTNWTFRNRQVVGKPLWLRFGQFNAKALVSTGGIMTLVVNALVLSLGLYHAAAVPVGVLAAFTWNWMWDSQFIFRQRSTGHAEG
jgi:putative flippase GtrA